MYDNKFKRSSVLPTFFISGAVLVLMIPNISTPLRCVCGDRRTGRNCSVLLSPCWSSPCLAVATCLDHDDTFYCLCPPFLTGQMCDIVFNPCSQENNPCQNEAVCIVMTSGIAKCLCQEGLLPRDSVLVQCLVPI